MMMQSMMYVDGRALSRHRHYCVAYCLFRIRLLATCAEHDIIGLFHMRLGSDRRYGGRIVKTATNVREREQFNNQPVSD